MENIQPEELSAENLEANMVTLYTTGFTLRNEIVSLLTKIRQYQIKLFTRRKKLQNFEEKLDALYQRFIKYDDDATNVLLFIATRLEDKHLGELVMINSKFSLLSSSRDSVRTVLQECSNALRNRQNQLDSRSATRIAVLALLATVILGVLSVIVAVIQLVLSPEVKPIPLNTP